MLRKMLQAGVAALLASSAAADPVTRLCQLQWRGERLFYRITLDEAARSVRIVSPEGFIWDFKNGVVGDIGTNAPPDMRLGAVDQFVKITPQQVVFGFYWSDEVQSGQVGVLPLASWRDAARPCHFSLWWAQALG